MEIISNKISDKSIFDVQADLCRCMSSAIRIEIVHCLQTGPQRVNDIAHIIGHSQSMISRNLGLLRNGGIVIKKQRTQEVIYQIANPKIVGICNLMREVLAEESSYLAKLVEGFQEEQPENNRA
jgi:ArsR family transcriptional regulator, virulence genes transcriptional regulator